VLFSREAPESLGTAEASLVADLLPRVRAFARARLRDRAAAEDFAQEAMMLTLEALREGKLEHPEQAGGRDLGVCRNLLRADFRKQRRRQELLQQESAASPHAGEDMPFEPLVLRLGWCLSRLREGARRVLYLTYVDDLESEAIAARLEWKAPNVRVTRKRALQALRACMEGGRPGEP
jgi:RNA polymerase sigma factor (sigma-70 family)